MQKPTIILDIRGGVLQYIASTTDKINIIVIDRGVPEGGDVEDTVALRGLREPDDVGENLFALYATDDDKDLVKGLFDLLAEIDSK